MCDMVDWEQFASSMSTWVAICCNFFAAATSWTTILIIEIRICLFSPLHVVALYVYIIAIIALLLVDFRLGWAVNYACGRMATSRARFYFEITDKL